MKRASRKGRFRKVVNFEIQPHPRGDRYFSTFILTLSCGHKTNRHWPNSASIYVSESVAMCPVEDCQFPGFVDHGTGI